MIRWAKDGYRRWRFGASVVEATANPTALRRWYVVEGPFAFGRGLGRGLVGGFFRLSEAKRAIEEAAS